MKSLIINLTNTIRILYVLVIYLLIPYLKNPIKPKTNKPISKPYRKIEVDTELPIVETIEVPNYKELLKQYEHKHGKPLKPINRRKKINFPKGTKCPYCGSPKEYIYTNNGSKGQCLCKVCNNTFMLGSNLNKKTISKCPYCGHTLEKTKDRNSFIIYKCKNDNCKYYQNKLNSLTKEEKEIYKSNPGKLKLRYIYREFKFSLASLNPNTPNRPKIDLAKAHNPLNVVGLIMTFYVNFGLSSRTVSRIMDEVFSIKVSHQTVLNYAQATAYYLSSFTKDHIKDLSSKLCGDETYIKVKGKWRYIFFILDPVKKILISSLVSKKRDTSAACTAIKQVIDCFKEIPEDLTFIFDGNPIYLLAKMFFAKNNIQFDLKTVIGLTNDDPISAEFRPYKQFIERLNRTFKDNYRHTNGFGSFDGAISYVTLFTAWFNFLRPHSALNGKVPIPINELNKYETMPAKWAKLIELAQIHTIENQKHKSNVLKEAA
ncbi:DDE-type integrase/transposase/recombinase [Caloranaerobacter azorensis]|uniref:DDE-type integrase/transposase/recombinase n=1 Tax=Caloranaerobacter azorensis TaxID=116090 RepID=UPI0020230826|nr:DDE-type integrase/transposase/recombinase [Caloranaerobacter azorensis]